jgi:F420-dependent oxidoreductase-like protein
MVESAVKIGIALSASAVPNYVDAVVGQARRVAGLGLDSVWFGQRLDYDSIALASIVGREVPEIHVGTAAAPIFGRHPVLVAGQAHTAQAATHGRYHLGIALGTPHTAESAFGMRFERPVARLREFLTPLRSLLETGSSDFHGELLTAAPAMRVSLPGATPPVPVLVAAMGPQTLRVTGELADGTLPYLAGPRTLANEIVPVITRAARRAGRPAPRIVAFLTGVVTDDVAAVRRDTVDKLAFFESVPSYQRIMALEGVSRAGELAVIGDEETVAAEVRRYFDAGATEVVFTQTDVGGAENERRTWRFLGDFRAARSA